MSQTKTLQPPQLDTPPLTRPPTPTRSLLVAPLQSSGALEPFPPGELLTPAIGLTRELSLKAILALPSTQRDPVLRDLALEISTHGVVFFTGQNTLTSEDLAELALAIGELSGKPADSTLHIHPTQELGENGLPVGSITNIADKSGRQISFLEDKSNLASTNWHTDVSFEPRPAAYTILQMHTLPKLGGDTLFSSSYATYEKLSPTMQAFLSTLTAVHDAETFRAQSAKFGFALRTDERGAPENVGDAFQATHPLVRTNPVTGWRALYSNITFTKRIAELNWDESDALLAYLAKIQLQSHDTQVRYRWSTNDVAIWDNRSTTHAATFDYTAHRAGNRVVVIGEVPYLDPHSVGRSEAEAQSAV